VQWRKGEPLFLFFLPALLTTSFAITVCVALLAPLLIFTIALVLLALLILINAHDASSKCDIRLDAVKTTYALRCYGDVRLFS
jgi:hypothetical protein